MSFSKEKKKKKEKAKARQEIFKAAPDKAFVEENMPVAAIVYTPCRILRGLNAANLKLH